VAGPLVSSCQLLPIGVADRAISMPYDLFLLLIQPYLLSLRQGQRDLKTAGISDMVNRCARIGILGHKGPTKPPASRNGNEYQASDTEPILPANTLEKTKPALRIQFVSRLLHKTILPRMHIAFL